MKTVVGTIKVFYILKRSHDYEGLSVS